jgi:hypothetical protein
MDKKNTGIIATIVTGLLCGCPGLASLCFGAFYAIVSQVPGAELDTFGSANPADALNFGIGGICVGIVFVAIPIVVGILMLRKKNEPAVSNEPVPPAI